MAWILAPALEKLRLQINTLFPSRDKSSDGSIGDTAHASRGSDHNPWVKDGRLGIVTAIDITHDPGTLDAHRLAEALRKSADPRLKYIISSGRIASAEIASFKWRPYHGSNPHNHHIHISVKSDKALWSNTYAWDFVYSAAPASPPIVPPAFATTLRVGDRSDNTPIAARAVGMLNYKGVVYSREMETYVREFQKSHGLIADGVIGPQTWNAIVHMKGS